METVFSKEGVVPLETETEWRISVIKLPFLDWELNPEFDLRISEDAAVREHGVRMVSDALRFAPEGGLEKLPPGVRRHGHMEPHRLRALHRANAC